MTSVAIPIFAVLAVGIILYFLAKKAIKITILLLCIGAAFAVLKYYLGVI